MEKEKLHPQEMEEGEGPEVKVKVEAEGGGGGAEETKVASSGTSIHDIISVPVVMDEIAKYLGPKDILAARLVSRDWAAAFENPFIKIVPVILDELNIKLFTGLEGGAVRERRMKHEKFRLRLQMEDARKTQAVVEFCETFAPQVKSLEVIVFTGVPSRESETPEEINGFCKMLEVLKDSLEELTVRLNGIEDPYEYGPWWDEEYEFPVMSRLKSLTFVLDKEDYKDDRFLNREDSGRTCFIPFIMSSCPNLEHLAISGFYELQDNLFRCIKEEGVCLKLQSLELNLCTVDAMKDLAEISFSPPLKRLRLWPTLVLGKFHGPGSETDYALPVSLSRFLKNVANDLISLDLRLRAVFEKDEDYHRGQNLPILPVMPKLRSLTLAALDADKSYFYDAFGVTDKLDLRFEESFGAATVPCMKNMYPELVKLRLILEADGVNATLNMIHKGSPHDGVKRVEIDGILVDCFLHDGVREFLLEQSSAAFPNSDLIFFLKD